MDLLIGSIQLGVIIVMDIFIVRVFFILHDDFIVVMGVIIIIIHDIIIAMGVGCIW